MTTTIYYFSATGNSLHVARQIQSSMDNVNLASMATGVNPTIPTERVGFVFPVFAWGLPRIVAEFIQRLDLSQATYVFAVATCVAIPGGTLYELDRILVGKGRCLDAGFVVKSGRSSLMRLNVFDLVMIALDRKRKKMLEIDMRIPEIQENVSQGKRHTLESSSWIANMLGTMIHKMAVHAFQTMDAQFTVSSDCKACGRCVRICPRGNISLENGRPCFSQNCELCHACIQWCPNFAIRHPNFDKNPTQYRNPAIQVGDLMRKDSCK